MDPQTHSPQKTRMLIHSQVMANSYLSILWNVILMFVGLRWLFKQPTRQPIQCMDSTGPMSKAKAKKATAKAPCFEPVFSRGDTRPRATEQQIGSMQTYVHASNTAHMWQIFNDAMAAQLADEAMGVASTSLGPKSEAAPHGQEHFQLQCQGRLFEAVPKRYEPETEPDSAPRPALHNVFRDYCTAWYAFWAMHRFARCVALRAQPCCRLAPPRQGPTSFRLLGARHCCGEEALRFRSLSASPSPSPATRIIPGLCL